MQSLGRRLPVRRVIVFLSMIGFVLPTSGVRVAGSPLPFAAAKKPSTTQLDWKRCDDYTDYSCARLAVPLDPRDPTVGSASLALIRVPASKKKKRLGVMLVNPGGPGASGRIFATQIVRNKTFEKLHESYDVIGWDPRGVGLSTPIRCMGPTGYDRYFAADPSPDNAAELTTLRTVTKEFADGCVRRNANLLSHVSTQDSVEDMERIRVALGEDRISYAGFSYGTYLGARYIDTYPTKVGRFILDGALDPLADAATRAELQARGFEVALDAFLNSCGKKCGFVRQGETKNAAFDRLAASIENTPLPVQWKRTAGASTVSEVRLLGPGEFSTGTLAALYNVNIGWPRLASALTAMEKGNGALLLQLFDLYADRGADGIYRNSSDANAATNCTDLPNYTEAEYDEFAARLAKKYPRFGAFAAYSILICAYWPSEGPVPKAVHGVGAPPVLVIGTTRDPATPYAWAESLSRQLTSSRLLTLDSDGHTAFLAGNRCIRKAVEAYALRGELPPVGQRCI